MKRSIITLLSVPMLFLLITSGAVRAVDGTSLVGHWRFDEGSRNIAFDSAGNNDGTLYGNPTWIIGKVGNYALDFDAVDDYVLVPASPDLPYGSIARTITMWIYTNPSSWRNNETSPFHYGLRDRRQAFGLDMHPYPYMQFYTWEDDLVFNTNAPLEGWLHVALMYDGNRTIKAYTQGEFRGSRSLGGALNTGFSDIEIGTFAHWYFTGKIDDVRFYDRALSDEEVQQLYEGAFPAIIDVDIKPGSCPNPLNLESKGLLPVAVLGAEDFDVNAIDPASIMLAGVSAIRSNYEDVSSHVIDQNECECNVAGRDGFVDLTLKFKTPQIVEEIIGSLDNPVAGEELVLPLTGALYDGTPIEGEDCVVLVGNVPRALAARMADIDRDGIVSMMDFAIVAQYWLELTPIEY
ncbi:MAG: LamG domain-containing protein [Planctomycetota bacterium]